MSQSERDLSMLHAHRIVALDAVMEDGKKYLAISLHTRSYGTSKVQALPGVCLDLEQARSLLVDLSEAIGALDRSMHH